MPGTSGQALEVRAADGGRVIGKQEQLQPWVCCGCGFYWVLVWHLQGSLDFKPQPSQMEEESPQALWQMCTNSKFLEKLLILPPSCLLGLASEGSWGAGLWFLLKL